MRMNRNSGDEASDLAGQIGPKKNKKLKHHRRCAEYIPVFVNHRKIIRVVFPVQGGKGLYNIQFCGVHARYTFYLSRRAHKTCAQISGLLGKTNEMGGPKNRFS